MHADDARTPFSSYSPTRRPQADLARWSVQESLHHTISSQNVPTCMQHQCMLSAIAQRFVTLNCLHNIGCTMHCMQAVLCLHRLACCTLISGWAEVLR